MTISRRILRKMRLFRIKVVQKIEIHISYVQQVPPPEKDAVNEIVWKNIGRTDRLQMTI
jgi:hypothetical protein